MESGNSGWSVVARTTRNFSPWSHSMVARPCTTRPGRIGWVASVTHSPTRRFRPWSGSSVASVIQCRRSGDVEAVQVHDLVPRSHEVTHELLLRVVARVDLGDGPELGVRAEDQVDGG